MERMAQDWAVFLCSSQQLIHRPLAPMLTGPYGSWSLLGENIGRGVAPWPVMHHAWVFSPGHLHNIVGPYTLMGVGHVACGDGLDYWVEDFARGF